MTLVGPILFALGLGACWGIGRYVAKGHGIFVPVASAVFGIAGLVLGFPEFWAGSFVWALVVLGVYGAIGSMVFRGGRSMREKSQ
jgi:hypothetical protein